MMSGRAGRQTLTALVTHKQESLQYLTVDSTTYLHWRTLARSLNLTSDCDVATFLLQHYEKTSDLQLTQCVKCCGPVVQFCVPCNIYMTQPTTPSPALLPHDSAALSVCDDAILSSDTILLDLGDVEADQFLLHDISMKTDGKTDIPLTEERREINPGIPIMVDRTGGISSVHKQGHREPSRLRMLMETCTSEEFSPLPAAAAPAPKPPSAAKSLLTPEVLQKLKSQAQKMADPCGSGTVFTSDGDTPPPPPPPPPPTATESQAALTCQGAAAASSSSSSSAESPLKVAANVSSSSMTAQNEADQCPSSTPAAQKAAESWHCAQPSGKMGKLSPSTVTSEKEAEFVLSTFTPEKDFKETAHLLSVSSSFNTAEPPGSMVTAPKRAECQPSDVTFENSPESLPSVQTSAQLGGPPDNKDVEGSAGIQLTPGGSAGIQLTPASNVSEESPGSSLCRTGAVEGRGPNRSAGCASAKSQTPGNTEASVADLYKAVIAHVPETGDSEDEDSDYHCRPLFTSEHCHKNSRTPQPCVHTKDPAPWLTASSTSGESRGVRTRQSCRKRRSSCTNNKENTDRRVTHASGVTERGGSAAGQVIIVTGHDRSHRPSRMQEKNPSQAPVYRSKRIAARMAARAENREATNQNPGFDEIIQKVSRVRGQVNNDSGGVTNVDTSGKVRDADTKVRYVDSRVSSVGSKVGSVDGKVSSVKKVSGAGSQGREVVSKGSDDVEGKVSVMLDMDSSQSNSAADARHKKTRGNVNKETKPYICPLCSDVFQLKRDRTAHIRERHGERPYACTQCSATYTMASHLRVHMNQHAEVKPHACALCPRAFARAYDLKVHHLMHRLERPVVCEVCGITLKTIRFLKSHMRTHNQSDKPFVCQLCGKTFRWRCNLTDHLRIHNNEKRFTCPECGISCIQSGSLRRHIERKHNPSRARPFVCDVCGEARFDKTQFEKHMMIHTGEKPFVCDICGAAFIQANALVGHRKIHTDREGKSHLCSLCGAAFKVLSSVKKHMSKVHNADSSELSVVAVEIIDLQQE